MAGQVLSAWIGVDTEYIPTNHHNIELWEASVISLPRKLSFHQTYLISYLIHGIQPPPPAVSIGTSSDDSYKEAPNLLDSDNPGAKAKHPRLHLLLEGDDRQFKFNDHELNALVEHWDLPVEFKFLLSHPELNSGFTWKRLQSKGNRHTLQIIMCFGNMETLVLSHDLQAKLTTGIWSTKERSFQNFQTFILDRITAETRHIHHPLFLPQQVLRGLVFTTKFQAQDSLETFDLALQNIKTAISSNYVDGPRGFDTHFLQASRGYFLASTTIAGDLENAVALGNFILKCLSDLDAFCDATLTGEQQEDFRDAVPFDIKRLQAFQASIEMKDAALQRNLLHDVINMRDGRVNKIVAKTSTQIARESKRDRSAIKTLAVLGTVFLPSTFVAALFSTPFFTFSSPASGAVSQQFWIFWAIAIPLTLVVILAWLVWYRWTAKKHSAEGDYNWNLSIFRQNWYLRAYHPFDRVRQRRRMNDV